MVVLNKIYTKKGDDGNTELGNGEPCSATHDDRGIWHENFQLSEIDAHPNEKGYKHIANFFNENFTDYKI